MALQSQLFRGDPNLEAAAVSPSAHITPGARGPHVAKIQRALILLNAAALAQDGIYGPLTAAAVADFKRDQQPPILNAAGQIDNIVGVKTTAALDSGMLAKERGGGRGLLGFKIGIDIADIVVRFEGAAAPSTMPADDVFSPALVPPYKRMPVADNQLKLGLFGRVLVRPDTGRFLLRAGRSTATIGDASRPVFVEVASDLVTTMVGLNLAPGNIFIFGSSSGGRNAIDFAAHLSGLGFEPHFVAAIDAAFFQTDTPSRPADSDDAKRPATVPSFSVNAGSTPKRLNFFQTIGNHVKRSLNPFGSEKRLFTSDMTNEEIHGTVVGFQKISLNQSITSVDDDDKAHEQCGGAGDREARRLIAGEILSTA
jgi:hypothetical protein